LRIRLGYEWSESCLKAMPEDQLSELLTRLKRDPALREKLKAAPDLQTAVLMSKEAGFDISRADLEKHIASQLYSINDEELEGIAGGTAGNTGLPEYYPIVGGFPNPCLNAKQI
jgi:predicted ribosomally synthesized peptide with nif11-like leader